MAKAERLPYRLDSVLAEFRWPAAVETAGAFEATIVDTVEAASTSAELKGTVAPLNSAAQELVGLNLNQSWVDLSVAALLKVSVKAYKAYR